MQLDENLCRKISLTHPSLLFGVLAGAAALNADLAHPLLCLCRIFCIALSLKEVRAVRFMWSGSGC